MGLVLCLDSRNITRTFAEAVDHSESCEFRFRGLSFSQHLSLLSRTYSLRGVESKATMEAPEEDTEASLRPRRALYTAG